jgi:hypothetical protein
MNPNQFSLDCQPVYRLLNLKCHVAAFIQCEHCDRIISMSSIYIVECRPFARKWLVHMQQRNKSPPRRHRATIGGLREVVFSVRSVPSYKQEHYNLVSCETVTGQYGCEHGSWGIDGVGSRYQTTTDEDTADWKDLVRAVVNCRVCELAIAL